MRYNHFAEQHADNEATPAAYSPRTGSQSLEEETVEQLNAAGYEAYHVTAANYTELENSLNTSFEDMDLDPGGSYIMVIHGEDQEETGSNSNPNSRLQSLPEQDHIGMVHMKIDT